MDFIKELKELVNKTNPKSLHIKLKKLDKNKLVELSSFLPNGSTIGQRVYHLVNDMYEIPKCPYCGNNKKLKDLREYSIKGYIHTCELDECKDKYHKEFNSPQENVKKVYGVDSYSQTESWNRKVKKTNLERRGVEWNTQSDILIKARRKSWNENKDEQIEKRIETNLEKYGTEYAIQSDIVKEKQKKTMAESEDYQIKRIEKSKETNFNKYNGWYCASPECQDKKYQRKEFIFPSGKKVMIQGYEDKALTDLIKLYNESDIIVGNKEIEKYADLFLYKTDDGITHRYYPDIFILSEHKIIEVKSVWTRNIEPHIQELKKKSCIDKGFNFEFMIY